MPAEIRSDGNGGLTYFGVVDTIIPAKRKLPEEYDKYFSRKFFVKNGNAYDLGYNVGLIRYNDHGDMLYSAIADIEKNERLLMMNYGDSRIILNNRKFDDIYDYGFSPAKEIYYAAQTYRKDSISQDEMSYLYIRDKLIGKYDYFSLQYTSDNPSVLAFDSKNNFAFVATERIDSINYRNIVVTNNGKLSFPQTKIPGVQEFSNISYLLFSRNDKMFYIGEAAAPSVEVLTKKEIFVENSFQGDIYDTISSFVYNAAENKVTFMGSRDKVIYTVTVNF
ncbi:MAG: hypothetical protein ABI462_04515 [Ignavibacteria bacterium]